MSRRSVLLIAEAANPEWTSVPLVGWSLCQALLEREDIDGHVVTHIRNRDALLGAGWVEGEQFTAIDSDAIAAPMYKLASRLRGGSGKGWTTVTALAALSYYYFEHLLWKRFGQQIREGTFDLVHRVTPLSPTIPGLLAKRCAKAGIPFFWGPINGGVPWPKAFDATRRKEREWLSYIRGIYKHMPGYRALRKHATAILVASRDTMNQIPPAYQGKCVYLPENGIDLSRLPQTSHSPVQRPVQAVFVGRLVPYKGADMLLEAAAPLIQTGDLRLTVIGDGPQRPDLEAMIERLGLQEGVTLAGWLEHRKVFEALAESDLLTFPSIREFGGGVVLEAMAVGCVPVIVDYGGPGELVTEDTGFRLPMASRPELVDALRSCLTSLCQAPEQITHRQAPAVHRVHEQFTWPAKAGQVVAVYERFCGAHTTTPGAVSPLPAPDPHAPARQPAESFT